MFPEQETNVFDCKFLWVQLVCGFWKSHAKLTSFQSSENSGGEGCFFNSIQHFLPLFKQLLYPPEMVQVVLSCKWSIQVSSDSCKFSNFKSIKSIVNAHCFSANHHLSLQTLIWPLTSPLPTNMVLVNHKRHRSWYKTFLWLVLMNPLAPSEIAWIWCKWVKCIKRVTLFPPTSILTKMFKVSRNGIFGELYFLLMYL